MDIKEWIETGVIVGAALVVIFKSLFKKKTPNVAINSKETDVPILTLLVDILFECNAIRSFIIQYHNGARFYSGQHIQRMTMSHEKHRPGLQGIQSSHDSMLVPSEIHEVNKELLRTNADFFYCKDRDLIHDSAPDLYVWMRDNSVVSLLYYKLIDTKTREPIGLLGICFNYKDPLDREKISSMKGYKRQFERIFDKL